MTSVNTHVYTYTLTHGHIYTQTKDVDSTLLNILFEKYDLLKKQIKIGIIIVLSDPVEFLI